MQKWEVGIFLSRSTLGHLFPRRVHTLVRALRNLAVRAVVELHPRVRLGDRPVHPEVVVSLTSFPPRISGCWVAIESIFQQTVHPGSVVLTLAAQEFPERKLPRRLRNLEKRGLEIIWVDVNLKSYDKLIPTKRQFPNKAIVTVDDDKILNRRFLEELLAAHRSYPHCVVGYRGWEMRSFEGKIHYGDRWVRATQETPSGKLFLPGNGGVLYPKHALGELLFRMDTALSLAPTADDFWFWGVVRGAGVQMKCLGKPPHVPIARLNKTPALRDINESANDKQFQKTMDYFGIRKTVIHECRAK